MSDLAQRAVLMPSINICDHAKQSDHDNCNLQTLNLESEYNSTIMVRGPAIYGANPNSNVNNSNHNVTDDSVICNAQEVLECYRYIGFQATQYGRAVDIARSMITKQPESTQYVIRDGKFVDANCLTDINSSSSGITDGNSNNMECIGVTQKGKKNKLVYPSIFLGITANLMGTGCREGIRFLVKHGIRPRCARCVSQERQRKHTHSANVAVEVIHNEKECESEFAELRDYMEQSLQPKQHTVHNEQHHEPNCDDSTDNKSDTESDDEERSNLANESDAVLEIQPAWMEKTGLQYKKVKSSDVHVETNNREEIIELPFKSFVDVLVVSGGAMEHDLRRACQPYYLSEYATTAASKFPTALPVKEVFGINNKKSNKSESGNDDTASKNNENVQFGNVCYRQGNFDNGKDNTHVSLFDILMLLIVARVKCKQDEIRTSALTFVRRTQTEPPICPWTLTPSQIWRLVGLWLVELMTFALAIYEECNQSVECKQNYNNGYNNNENNYSNINSVTTDEKNSSASILQERKINDNVDLLTRITSKCYEYISEYEDKRVEYQRYLIQARQRAETTVLYWAALQEVPIFSPSFVDGDVMEYLHMIYKHSHLDARHVDIIDSNNSRSSIDAMNGSKQMHNGHFQLDLVSDIHALNKFAMRRRHSGMLICGGGVVKHHICNANLMRNGADKAIFLNNGSEFDGSDAGARPEEALSWGKIRIDGNFVKVYGEVTTTLPLLVGQVFIPAARRALQQHLTHQNKT